MRKVKVIVEWASDGTVGVMMEDDLFAGQGDTVEEAIEDMREGVKFFVETSKEKGYGYKKYLDEDFEVELNYDIQSMLQYARKYMTDAGLSALTGINQNSICRYANGKVRPRPNQARKIMEGLKNFGNVLSTITL